MEASNVCEGLPATVAFSFPNLFHDIKMEVARPDWFCIANNLRTLNCKVEYRLGQRVEWINFWVFHVRLMDSKIEKDCLSLYLQIIEM